MYATVFCVRGLHLSVVGSNLSIVEYIFFLIVYELILLFITLDEYFI